MGLMLPEEAANFLRITKRQVLILARRETLKAVRLGRRTVRFRLVDLEAHLPTVGPPHFSQSVVDRSDGNR